MPAVISYVLLGTAQHSTAQHSTAQHRAEQHSAAQGSAAQGSTAQDSTAQDSTGQRSTARHGTAQHSTAQHVSSIAPHLEYLLHMLTQLQCGSKAEVASHETLYPTAVQQPWHECLH